MLKLCIPCKGTIVYKRLSVFVSVPFCFNLFPSALF